METERERADRMLDEMLADFEVEIEEPEDTVDPYIRESINKEIQTMPATFALSNHILRRCDDVRDKVTVIENTVGFDMVLSMISNGVKETEIAALFGLTKGEFMLMMTQNKIMRSKYMSAKTFTIASKSMSVVDFYSDALFLSREQKAALDFHGANIDRAIKANGEEEIKDINRGVVINNVLSVSDNRDVEMPRNIMDITRVLEMED